MRFILVGAPGVNKGKLARSVAKNKKLKYVSGLTVPSEHAVGVLADYRVELKLATDRCFATISATEDSIFEHSLIDSLAYSSYRFVTVRDYSDQYNIDKWAAT